MVSAITEWEALLSREYVITDGRLTDYQKCTSGAFRTIVAVLLPDTVEHIQQIVRIAGRYCISLHPISTGKNWGYGTCNPIEDNCVIVDLSRMNRILDFDQELGTVTLQPGVTQGQLYAYIQKKKLPFYAPITGSSPDCSIIGNALERGFGLTPTADHFLGLNALHAVLPDSSLYTPLMEELGGARSQAAYKWGVGPYLDGLFSQGGFGIVTQATIELAPRYEALLTFGAGIKDTESLIPLLEASRKLQAQSGLTFSNIKFFNSRYQLALEGRQPPSGQVDGIMSQEQLSAAETYYKLYHWVMTGGIYCDKELLPAARKIITRYLKVHTEKLVFFTESKLRAAETLAPLLPKRINKQVAGLRVLMDYQQGRPSENGLKLAYWKSRTARGVSEKLDPARDGCGLMWYAPILPYLPDIISPYINLVEATCLEFGIEPVINLTSRTKICIHSLVILLYDPESQQQTARSCREALLERGRDQLGIFPYRLNIEEIRQNGKFQNHMGARLKKLFDPDNIVDPGKFG